MIYKVLLIDDEALVAERTKYIIEEFSQYKVKDCAYNYKETIRLLESYIYDLAIVDINLESEKNGFDIAKMLNEKNIPFLFLTSYSDQDTLTNAIVYNPAGYVVKPIQKENLFSNLEILRMRFLETDKITVKDGKNEFDLNISHIYYISSEGNYCELHTLKGKILHRGKLSDWPKKSDFLVRIHKSYAVNIAMIHKKSKKEITLKNGVILPFSSVYTES